MNSKFKITVSNKTFTIRFFVFEFALFITILALVVLIFLAKSYPFFPIDLTITRFIQSINFPGFSILMRFITMLGNLGFAVPLTLVFMFLLLTQKMYKDILILLISTVGLAYIGIFLKSFVARPRPDPLLVLQDGFFNTPDSFPSGHVLFYISFFGFLLFLSATRLKKGRLRNFSIIANSSMLILIGISRIYVGAHWFSDTLGSYLIGAIWLYIIVFLNKIFVTKTSIKKF